MSETKPLSSKPCCACKRARETCVRAWARVRCFELDALWHGGGVARGELSGGLLSHVMTCLWSHVC
jgi:hypothetical protein